MSLIDDALKRQDEIRRGIAPPPPSEEASRFAREADDAPPVDLRVRSAAPQAVTAAPVRRPEPAPAPRASRTPPPKNPFLERERLERRRRNPNVILMPLLGLIVFLVLLFLRNEFVPQAEKPVRPVRTPLSDTAVVDDLFPEPPREDPAPSQPVSDTTAQVSDTESPREGRASSRPVPDTTAQVPDTESPREGRASSRPVSDTTTLPDTESPWEGRASSRPVSDTTTLPDTEPPREGRASSGPPPAPAQVSDTMPSPPPPPPPAEWPAFTLTGIAVGRERLAILNSGEMLLAGETAKCGVKVEKVDAASVVFSWKGETKTLRKGEQSDKPADTAVSPGQNPD